MIRRDFRAPKPRVIVAARWWLPLAIFVSLIVHLLLGVNAVRFLNDASGEKAVASSTTSGPVTVEVRPNQEAGDDPKPAPQANEPKAPKAPKLPKTAKVPQPTQEAPQAQPSPQPTPIVEPKEAPTVTEQPIPEPSTKEPVTPPTVTTSTVKQPRVSTTVVPTTTPETRVENITVRPTQPTTGGFIPDRLEAPLPQGDLSGNPELERTPRPLAALATPSPLPPRTLEKIEGRGGGGGGETSVPTPATVAEGGKPAPGAGGGVGGSDSGKGGGTGGGIGADRGAGAGMADGNGLGINRGIPFGDKTGIADGNVRRGGGVGGGPGGGVPGGNSGGGPRFTLGRRSGGGGPPVHIVYVLDISGSMDEDGKIDRTREAMSKALSELHPEDSFNIILFSDNARASYPSLRPASAFYISNGQTQVDIAEPRGATNFSAAIQLAFAQEGATHIFFMSDGEPTEGETDFSRLRAMVRQQNTAHIRVITLALGSGENFKGMTLLKAMAEENGGRYSYINLSKR